MKTLLVEDDAELRTLIAASLSARGFFVDVVGSSEDADLALQSNEYRVAIFDRNLPDGDGLAILRKLRMAKKNVPVLVLTAASGAPNRIEGLDAGADDYLEKPFDMNELAARLRALCRRPTEMEEEGLAAGRVHLVLSTFTAHTPEGVVKLTRRETALLEQFMRRIGVTVLREKLESAIYGFDDDVSANALEAHISRLRSKLRAANAGLEVHAMPGIGYLMSAAPS
jgi:two-component system, OmpR family, response regulator